MEGNSDSSTAAAIETMTAAAMRIPYPFTWETVEDIIGIVEDIVEHHNVCYNSVNFGEHLIKEMVMSSVFGIPMSPKV